MSVPPGPGSFDPVASRGDPADARAETLARVRRFARLMDTAVRIPGTRIRFGLDAVLGLLPVAGDTVSLLLGAGTIAAALRLGCGPGVIARMIGNLLLDWLLSLVPLADLVLDVAFKAHVRNLRLLERALADRAAS